MSTVNAETALTEIASHAETIKNNEPKVWGSEWMVGDSAAQGDINIVCLRSMPVSAKPRDNRQMAEGNTMGSRHALETGECFTADLQELQTLIKEATGQEIGQQYLGPVFTGPAHLSHPEHAHQHWTEKCVNAVVYQRSWDAEQGERRARD